MKKISYGELAALHTEADRERHASNVVLQYILDGRKPDAVERFRWDVWKYEYRLYGVHRADGGTLLVVGRTSSNEYPSIRCVSFDQEYSASQRESHLPGEFRTALSRLQAARRRLWDIELGPHYVNTSGPGGETDLTICNRRVQLVLKVTTDRATANCPECRDAIYKLEA